MVRTRPRRKAAIVADRLMKQQAAIENLSPEQLEDKSVPPVLDGDQHIVEVSAPHVPPSLGVCPVLGCNAKLKLGYVPGRRFHCNIKIRNRDITHDATTMEADQAATLLAWMQSKQCPTCRQYFSSNTKTKARHICAPFDGPPQEQQEANAPQPQELELEVVSEGALPELQGSARPVTLPQMLAIADQLQITLGMDQRAPMTEPQALRWWNAAADLAVSAHLGGQKQLAYKVFRTLVNASSCALTKDESKQERPRPELPSYNPERQRIRSVYLMWSAGKWSKGMKLMSRTSGFLDLSKDENRRNTMKRFLKGGRAGGLRVPEVPEGATPILDVEMVTKALRKKATGKAPGLDGITYDFLKAMLKAQAKQNANMVPTDPAFHGPTSRFAENLAHILNWIVDGSFARDPALLAWMTTNKGTAAPKAEPVDGIAKDIRPISIMPSLVSLAHSALARHPDVLRSIKEVISEMDVTHGVKGCTEAIPLAVLAACRRVGIAVIQIDWDNAFGSLFHQRLLDIAKTVPALAATLVAFYALPSRTVFGPGSMNEFDALLERGMPQGAPLSGLLLALATCTPKTDALAKKYGVMILRYVDDISIVGPAEHLAKVYRSFRKELGSAGVLFNPKKGGAIIPDHVPSARKAGLLDLCNTEGIPVVDGLTVLGIPIGTDEFVRAKSLSIVGEALNALGLYRSIVDAYKDEANVRQMVMTVLKLATVPGSINYLLRAVPGQLLLPALKEFDDRIIEFILWVLEFKPEWLSQEETELLRERVWLDAIQGGAGINSVARLAPYAHLGALGLCIRTMVERGMLFRNDDGSLDLPTMFPEAHQLIQSGMLKKVRGLEKVTLQSMTKGEPLHSLQKQLTKAHCQDRMNGVLALIDKDPSLLHARAELLSKGGFPAAAWLYAIINPPKDLAHHCILRDQVFKVAYRDLLGLSPLDAYHDPQRPVPEGMVLACGCCDGIAHGRGAGKKATTYLFNNREVSIHSARCIGRAKAGPQATRTSGHYHVQHALQTVAARFWKTEGLITHIKPSPVMADHFLPAREDLDEGPIGIGAAQPPIDLEEVDDHKERKNIGQVADLLIGTTKGSTLLDVTIRSHALPTGNPFGRPLPNARSKPPAVKPVGGDKHGGAAYITNHTNNKSREVKVRLYGKNWNLTSSPGAEWVVAAFEQGGRWHEPFVKWFDSMFDNAIEDTIYRSICKAKAYQIMAVAVRRAVAHCHLTMYRLRHTAFRIVKPPKELLYLLPLRQKAH